ncbi:MAG: hypothetical protein HYU41_17020 [Candidatus Rokubacteria bacterium]|nr:hypothetical protein [Candidatus Rokubacteria bacterium]
MTTASPRMPAVGEAAPAFTLPAPDGIEIGLADFRGRRRVVLWFSKGLF